MRLVELNEVNFDLVSKYIDNGANLPFFSSLLSEHGYAETYNGVQDDYLEPWIQWPSFHLGLTPKDHGMFHLGDSPVDDPEQIFEMAEQYGHKVGVLSAMGASNRLVSPAFFVPDPWSGATPDESRFCTELAKVLERSVNSNAQSKLLLKDLVWLSFQLFLATNVKEKYEFVRECTNFFANRTKKWKKAILLDRILIFFFQKLMTDRSATFGTLFLNGVAHIQHHHMLESSLFDGDADLYDEDPILSCYQCYDSMLDRLCTKYPEWVIATGLSQKPITNKVYFYRLDDHSRFLTSIGLINCDVQPLMSRDFWIHFKSELEAKAAIKTISRVKSADGQDVFGNFSIKANSLFVSLIFHDEITEKSTFLLDRDVIDLFSMVSFVAIKNSGHADRGYVFYSEKGKAKNTNRTSLIELRGILLEKLQFAVK